MKKRFLAAALALAMLLMMVPSAFAASDGFDDVSGHWAEDAINRWSGYGVVNGVGDNQFAPNGTLTRAQAAQVFANLLDLEVQADISRYTDVPEDSWYHTAIAQCVAAGILTGTGGSTMDPQSPVTREELFVMFARALNIRPQSSSDVTFGDSGEVSGWAQGYINALADRGFVSGVGGGMLAPGEAINRASVMSLLDKTISDYANTSGTTVGNASGVVLVVADNVSVAGDVDTLVVYGGSASVTGSQVAEATVAGENASLSVSGSAVVERVDVAGTEAVLTLTGSVRAGQVTVSGESAQVSLSGQAQAASVAVEKTAAGAGLTVGAGSAVTTVDSAAANVIISGSGTVETANVSGNNTTVNTDGTDLTVAQGTTGVTENDKPVSGGTTVETKPETQQPVTPPVHIHSYIATEIKAADADITVGVQYTCYAGDDSYIEWNGNAVAKVGNNYYVDLNNAVSAGGTVDLLKDVISPTESIVVDGKTVVLNLNGKTISASGYDGAIYAKNGAQVTINGEGTIIGNDVNKYAMAVWSNGAGTHVTINGGTYQNNKAEGNTDSQMDMIYASDGGTITINGGTFDCITPKWTLNVKDANYKENPDTIQVYGGTFKDYNPAKAENENPVANFVASNYTVTFTQEGEDTWYTVVPRTAEDEGTVAEANGIYYDNLAEALTQTNSGTVTVLQNVETSEQLVVNEGSTITLDLNGKKINSTCMRFSLANYGTLTIQDSGETGAIYNSSKETDEGNYGHDAVRNFGILYIEGGHFGDADTDQTNANDTTYGAAVRNQDSAICIINGGYFTCVDNYGAWADTGNTAYSYAIRNFGTMTINGGEVYGAMNGGVAGDDGSIIINDGSFSVTGEKSFHVLTTNTSSDAQITINGGTFTKSGNNNYLLSGFKGMPSWDASDDLEGNGYIVNGGTFIKNDETVIFTQPDV